MAKISEKDEKERKDMPVLFFFGLGLSGLLIWLLNKKGGGKVSATLNGVLDSDGGAETKVSFEYGTQEGAWTESPRTAASTGTEFSLVVPNLFAETTYYFRARAENEAGITWGEVLSIQT